MLAAAFARSLRDPFVHARNAALLALAATSEVFAEDDCANKILPALCPSIVDKEKYSFSPRPFASVTDIFHRLVRDQANKTLDIYLQRVRKFGSTLPDTALPPSAAENTGEAAPRMIKAQNDSSWAGWAVSSFTNKVAAASGEMNTNINGDSNKIEARSASMPPTANNIRGASSIGPASSSHRNALASPPSLSRPLSETASASTLFEDAEAQEEDFEAWGEMDEDSFFDAPSEAVKVQTKPAPAFDDGGEPDFAGWLAAQEQSKSKKPLPKGLVKPAGRQATTGRTMSTTSVGTGVGPKKLATAPPKPKVVIAKKLDTKPKDSDEGDDGWGDGW